MINVRCRIAALMLTLCVVTIIYVRCNDFFFFFFSFKLLQQNVFIYLDVTDYLKFLDFFFSALFSTVCFLSLQWIDWPSVIIIIVMAWSILGLFVLFFFFYFDYSTMICHPFVMKRCLKHTDLLVLTLSFQTMACPTL